MEHPQRLAREDYERQLIYSRLSELYYLGQENTPLYKRLRSKYLDLLEGNYTKFPNE